MRHPLFPISLYLAAGLAALCILVVLGDALMSAYAERRRRRRRESGIYGVVLDAEGRVLGTYLDPFATVVRRARVHDAGSPWASGAPEGRGWAWEGFGETALEARVAADSLRHRHLRLFPWLAGGEDEEDGEGWKG